MWRWLVICVAIGVAVAGCGGSEEETAQPGLTGTYDGGEVSVEADKGKVVAKNKKTGESVTVTQQDDRVEVKGQSGGQEFTATTQGDSLSIQTPDTSAIYGAGDAELPADMAEDIPTHPNMSVLTVVNQPKRGEFMYQAQIGSPPNAIMSHYEDKATAAGWSVVNRRSEFGMNVVAYKKDDRRLNVLVIEVPDGSQVSVSVSKETEKTDE